jgi:hypothetical protein
MVSTTAPKNGHVLLSLAAVCGIRVQPPRGGDRM